MSLTRLETVAIVLWAGVSVQAAEPNSVEIRHGAALRALVFSADGKFLLTGSEDHTVGVWETATGKAVCGPLTQADVVKSVAFSPDGRTVATASGDRTARLWNAQTGNPIGKILRHKDAVNVVAFTLDGKQVLTGSDDFTAQLWDAATGEPAITLRHPQKVSRLAVLPDGRTALMICKDQTICKWDLATGKQLGVIGTGHYFNALSVTYDGRVFLTGSRNAGCQLWDLTTGQSLIPELLWQFDCADVGFSWDSRIFYTRTMPRGQGSRPSGGRLWETATCKQIGQPLPRLSALAFHPNGRTLAVADFEGVVKFRDLADQSTSPGQLSLSQLWQNLEGPRATPGIAAVVALAAMPDEALPLLEKHLQPVPPTDAGKLGKLIANLDDDSFDVREKAEEELGRAGAAAEIIVWAALAKKPTPEVEQRLRRLLGITGTVPDSAERLGSVRGIQVLEMIGTPRAQQLLRALARGAPQLYISCAAQSALERLAGKASKSRAGPVQ